MEGCVPGETFPRKLRKEQDSAYHQKMHLECPDGAGGWFQGCGEWGCQNWHVWPRARSCTPQQGARPSPISAHFTRHLLWAAAAGGAGSPLYLWRQVALVWHSETPQFPIWPPGHTLLDRCSQARPLKGRAKTAPEPLWVQASQPCTADVCIR